jgi:hypothetical protein
VSFTSEPLYRQTALDNRVVRGSVVTTAGLNALRRIKISPPAEIPSSTHLTFSPYCSHCNDRAVQFCSVLKQPNPVPTPSYFWDRVNEKFSLCLRSGGIAQLILNLCTRWSDVSNQLHAPVHYPRRKNLRCPLGGIGRPQSQSGRFWKDNKLISLAGNRTAAPRLPICCLVPVPT